MTKQKFKSEMRRAETMSVLADPMMSEYWVGYIRGLRRAYHGEKFGEPGEHEKWLSSANSRNESLKQRGRGYKDGLAFSKISSRIGRPPVGDTVLDKLTVPGDLKSGLEAKAAALGISVPDARREAYRMFSTEEDKMGNTNSKINFRAVVMNAIGTTRECNDGSGCDSFTISTNEVDGIADNLDAWWNEKYGDVDSTLENAEEYFDETYPEAK